MVDKEDMNDEIGDAGGAVAKEGSFDNVVYMRKN